MTDETTLTVYVGSDQMPQAGHFPVEIKVFDPDDSDEILEAVAADRAEALDRAGDLRDGVDFDSSSWQLEVARMGDRIGFVFADRFPTPDDEFPDEECSWFYEVLRD